MKFIWLIFVLFISCSTKQEAKEVGKDPNADWLTIYNADSARIDFKNGKRRILSYGMGMLIIPEKVHDSLCKAFNFEVFQAADCEVTDAFVKGAEEYNAEMRKLLEQVNGKNWHDRYVQVIDSFMTIEQNREIDEGNLEMEEYRKQRIEDSIKQVKDSIARVTKYKESLKKKCGSK